MWEDITVTLCGIGFLFGLISMGVGLLGTVMPGQRWLPPHFR